MPYGAGEHDVRRVETPPLAAPDQLGHSAALGASQEYDDVFRLPGVSAELVKEVQDGSLVELHKAQVGKKPGARIFIYFTASVVGKENLPAETREHLRPGTMMVAPDSGDPSMRQIAERVSNVREGDSIELFNGGVATVSKITHFS